MLLNFMYLLIMDPVRLVTLERECPGRAYPEYEQGEPGFAAPFLQAYIDTLTNQTHHGVSHDVIQRIHRLSTSHLSASSSGQYRVAGGNFNISISSEEMIRAPFHGPDYSATVKGIWDFINYWLDPTKQLTTHVLVFSNKKNPYSGYFLKNQGQHLMLASVVDRRATSRVFDLTEQKNKNWLDVLIRSPEYQCSIEIMTDIEDGHVQTVVQNTMDNIIHSFQASIRMTNSDDEKIRIIATCVQRIAQCHPFNDGNIRTCCILLNKLLQDYGLPLTLLINPNHFDCCDEDYLVHTIKNGQGILSALLQYDSTANFTIQTDDAMQCLRSIECKPYDMGEPELVRRLCGAITPTSLATSDVFFSSEPTKVSVDDAKDDIMQTFDSKKQIKICEAMARKDYALVFRNACVKKLYPLIMALMKHKDTLAFDLNVPSSNGNTALDWLDHNVENSALKQHQVTRARLCALGGVSGQCEKHAPKIENLSEEGKGPLGSKSCC